MTDALTGKSAAQIRQMTADVHRMFADGSTIKDKTLKEMEALASVRHYPSRIKCATLAWTTVAAALNGDIKQISTEN